MNESEFTLNGVQTYLFVSQPNPDLVEKNYSTIFNLLICLSEVCNLMLII